MNKTSLFILLTFFTFSLSESNIKIRFQHKHALIGINEIEKVFDSANKKMKLSNMMIKAIQDFVTLMPGIEKYEQSRNSTLSSSTNKLRE